MTHYTYDEALQTSLRYFDGDELAARVFVDKYALRNNNGDILEDTPDKMHRRIAKELARVEQAKFNEPLSEDEIFELLDKFRYVVPQGSILYGCGNKYQFVSLANCFLAELPLDSYCDILRIDEQLVNISKRRGGVGINISNLRPKNTRVSNAARTSTGIVPFIERYSNSIREVGQGGRRGALLICLNIHHPDIQDFIVVKNDRTKVTGANISVLLTDEFMQAVENNTTYELRFPIDYKEKNIEPLISTQINAREVWNLITKNAHEHAEPGLLFYDTIKTYTPSDCYDEFRTMGTNPCSEISMQSGGQCILLLLNILSYVDNPFTDTTSFNKEKFIEHAKKIQRLADDVVDLEITSINRILSKIEQDPEPFSIKRREWEMWAKIKEQCQKTRRTGVGLTGIADFLAALNIPYGSPESISTIEEVYKLLKLSCYRSSVDMSKELGPFEGWDQTKEQDNPFLLQIKDEDPSLYEDMSKYGRRNIALLTTSPGGSVSLLTQTTSGIEPCFKLSYKRRKKGNPNDKDFRIDFTDKNGDTWMEFEVTHPQVKKWKEITQENDITKSPWFGCCASDIEWQNRLLIQREAQKHTCHGISSTINLPKDTSVDEVSNIYLTAWKYALKGITVYRQGSRDGVLVDSTQIKDRPKTIPCDVFCISVKGHQYFVLVGLLDGKPYEMFAGKNGHIDHKCKKGEITKKKKNFYKATLEDDTELSPITATTTDLEDTITRLVSGMLRNNISIDFIVTQLEKVQGEMTSLAKCLARVLKKYIKDGTISDDTCPECNHPKMIYEGGCKRCEVCSYSKCN